MKCEDVSNELIAYLDRRANSADRAEVEAHLNACAGCRARAEEFRRLWNVLDEVPLVEPSLGFDARARQQVAAQPKPRWLTWLVPQPRLAFSLALLVALCIWLAKLPPAVTPVENENAKFEMIQDLPVLENYDVLSKFDALSELPPATAEQNPPAENTQPDDDSGAPN
jgi:anti-sigma factor RsiW